MREKEWRMREELDGQNGEIVEDDKEGKEDRLE